MPTYGLTPTGFVAKPLAAILADMQAAQIAALGTDWDVSAESPEGQLNAIVATAISQLWELGAAVYAARDPNGATYAALDAVAQITGTQRQAATPGKVVLSVTLAAGATLPAGSIANVAGQPSNQWATLAAVTNSGMAPATLPVNAQAVTPGAFAALAGTITGIATPQAGWTAVTNAGDAMEGSDVDNDAALRARRVRELAAGAGSTESAIVAKLLGLGSIKQALCFVNDTDLPVAGPPALPPHSVGVVAYDGTPTGTAVPDAVIGGLVWSEKPAGVATAGTSPTVTVTDVNGQPQLVYFSRPAVVPVYLEIDVTKGPAWNDTTTPAAIKAALIAYADGNPNPTPPALPVAPAYQMGTSVIRSFLFGVCAFDPTQVADVTNIKLGTTPGPTGTANIPITTMQLATFDTSRITVVGS